MLGGARDSWGLRRRCRVAAEVLHEGMAGGEDPRGAVTLQAAHRLQPCFQPPVACLGRVVRMLLNGVRSRGNQLIEDPRVNRGAIGGDPGRDRAGAQCAGEEAPGRRPGRA